MVETIKWKKSTTGIGDYVEPEEKRLWKQHDGGWFRYKTVRFYRNWMPISTPLSIEDSYEYAEKNKIYAWNIEDLPEKEFFKVIREFCAKYGIPRRKIISQPDPAGW